MLKKEAAIMMSKRRTNSVKATVTAQLFRKKKKSDKKHMRFVPGSCTMVMQPTRVLSKEKTIKLSNH